MQQGDVKLVQTTDGGEIEIVNGLVTMSGGLETAAYLSLFGGNEDDDGRRDNPATWWGNLSETETAFQYRSETQNLLQAIAATSGNLKRIEDAARRDLAWLIEVGAASVVTVEASIPGLNMIQLDINIDQEGLTFIENWRAAV